MAIDRRKKNWFSISKDALIIAGIIGLAGWIWSEFTFMTKNFPVALQRIQYLEKAADQIEDINKTVNELKRDQEIISERQLKVIKILNELTIMHQIPDRQIQSRNCIEKTATREKKDAD